MGLCLKMDARSTTFPKHLKHVIIIFTEITSKVIAESQHDRAKLQYVPVRLNLYQCAQIALFAQKARHSCNALRHKLL